MTEVLEQAQDEKKANHQANVVRIKTIYPHPDPETTNLELIEVEGYQVVVRKGEFQIGDLAVYVTPDSVIPQTAPFAFIWEGHVGLDGTVPEKRRRVTVRKFRKEWSEGLLLPVTDFAIDKVTEIRAGVKHVWFGLLDLKGNPIDVHEGDDVSDLLGITHYDPDTAVGTRGDQGNSPKRKIKYPKTFKGWCKFIWYHVTGRGRKAEALLSVPFVVPTYDVDAFKNYKSAFDGLGPDDKVVVTEKIHGSNARFIFLGGVMYAGSKNQWKAPSAGSTWHKALEQNHWIEDWCRSNEGCAIYGEVVPTQGKYSYGCKEGEVKFFAFDVYDTNGKWVGYNELPKFELGGNLFKNMVPLLYYGPFDKEKIMKLADGPSFVKGAGHIREGFVIKSAEEKHVRGLGRLSLKVVSNKFLEGDSK